MTEPTPDYVTQLSPPGIHTAPAQSTQLVQLSQDQIRAARQQFREQIFQIIVQSIKGLFIPSGRTGGAEKQFNDWIEDIPILGDIAEVLTGVEDGNLHDMGTWANGLLSRLRPVPKVTSGTVGDEHPQLLLAPDFRASATLVASQNWSWSNSFGFDSLGCAQVIAAGYVTELLSNEIPVTAEQSVMDFSVRVKASGLVYTGSNPISMGITYFMNRTEIGEDDLMVLVSPASTFDWTELFKDGFQIPAGCDEIRMRLKVNSNVSAGTIYWDDASVTTIGMGLIDNIVRGLENVNRPGWDLTDLLLSMFNQFRTTTDHATRIALLEAANSPGNKINDEFFRTGSDLGPNWHLTYTGGGGGTWETDGDYAFWDKAGISTREVRCRWIGTPATTLTNTQKITAVTGSKGQGFLGFRSHSDLYGRMDTSEANWIRVRFSSNGDVTLTRCLANVLTDIATVTVAPLSGGSTVILYCGTSDGDRFFRVEIDGVAVIGGETSPVSDTTSALGTSFLGYGHGAKAEGNLLILGQCEPCKLNAWAAQDN